MPHFVPTSSSWLNLVERWFGHLDSKAIRRVISLSVADLLASIRSLPRRLEQRSEAIHLDRHFRIHPGKAYPLPTNSGEDPARLYESETQKSKENNCLVISQTLH